MRTRTLAVSLALLIPTVAWAASKHENHYKPVSAETDAWSLTATEGQAQDEFARFKLELTNSTDDWLYFDPTQVVMHFPTGDQSPEVGLLRGAHLIAPKSSTERTLAVKGAGLHHDTFTVDMGGIFVLDDEAEPLAFPDFQLPASKNDVEAGPLACEVGKIKQETKITKVPFECTYTGDHALLVDGSRIAVRVEDGQEFSTREKPATQVLLPGDSTKVVAVFKVPAKVTDMQFATMQLVWNDTFIETELQPTDAPTLTFELDPALTAERNGL
jgi:hypothetical protein